MYTMLDMWQSEALKAFCKVQYNMQLYTNTGICDRMTVVTLFHLLKPKSSSMFPL